MSRRDLLTFPLLCADTSFVTRWLERYLEGGVSGVVNLNGQVKCFVFNHDSLDT